MAHAIIASLTKKLTEYLRNIKETFSRSHIISPKTLNVITENSFIIIATALVHCCQKIRCEFSQMDSKPPKQSLYWKASRDSFFGATRVLRSCRDACQIFSKIPHQFLRRKISFKPLNWAVRRGWLWVGARVLKFCNLNAPSKSCGWSAKIIVGWQRSIWKSNFICFFRGLIVMFFIHCTNTVYISQDLFSARNCG